MSDCFTWQPHTVCEAQLTQIIGTLQIALCCLAQKKREKMKNVTLSRYPTSLFVSLDYLVAQQHTHH